MNCELCGRLLPHFKYSGLCPDCYDEVMSIGSNEHETWLKSEEGIRDSYV